MEIDREHLLDHLVLPEIDLRFGDREEQRLEDAPRRRVLAGERGGDAVPEVFVDLHRIGVRHAACGLRELEHLVDDFRRRRRGTIIAARSGAAEERVLDGSALVVIEPFERLADERAELVGVQRAECARDVAATIGLLSPDPLPSHLGSTFYRDPDPRGEAPANHRVIWPTQGLAAVNLRVGSPFSIALIRGENRPEHILPGSTSSPRAQPTRRRRLAA